MTVIEHVDALAPGGLVVAPASWLDRAVAADVELMGLPLLSFTEGDTVAAIVADARRGHGGWLCPVNLDVLRQVQHSEDLRALVERADMRVADGMPLVTASRLRGTPLPERVAGSSVVVQLTEVAAAEGLTVHLIGGAPGVARRAAERLVAAWPALRVVGTACPPEGFERDVAQLDAIEAELRLAAPNLIYVGLGFPKQERFIERILPALPEAWFVSCGAGLSFLSGDASRAPEWMQRGGLEWLHRLGHEPRRLFRRYVVQGIPFAIQLHLRALRERTARVGVA